jgi:L-ribulose-5-phosphate 3-epimerase
MTSDCSRRAFLEAVGAALPASLLGLPALHPASPAASRRDDPLFRISLAEWSLHRALDAGTLDHLDFPLVARRDYGIEAVEYVNTFFRGRGADERYLAELKARVADHGVKSLLIMCDGEGAIGDPDPAARTRTIENHFKWLDAAAVLGCHSIRVNAQSEGSDAQQHDLVVDGLRRLTEVATLRDLNVIVENHGGLSSNGAWLAGVIRAVGHPRCGTLPDFGNFQLGENEWYDRYRGVAEMMPFAKAVSAKSHAFDAEGNERQTDFRRMLKIVLDAGYHGHLGIEYEGDELSEPDGIRATKALLERVRAELTGA